MKVCPTPDCLLSSTPIRREGPRKLRPKQEFPHPLLRTDSDPRWPRALDQVTWTDFMIHVSSPPLPSSTVVHGIQGREENRNELLDCGYVSAGNVLDELSIHLTIPSPELRLGFGFISLHFMHLSCSSTHARAPYRANESGAGFPPLLRSIRYPPSISPPSTGLEFDEEKRAGG